VDNPTGIESVSDDHAMALGELRGHGGPGAAGATVAGPLVHHATEGGTKPLPVRNLPDDVKTSAGKAPGKNQPTSQEAALNSGKIKDEEISTDHNQLGEIAA
jgi:hypothetical protein